MRDVRAVAVTQALEKDWITFPTKSEEVQPIMRDVRAGAEGIRGQQIAGFRACVGSLAKAAHVVMQDGVMVRKETLGLQGTQHAE